MRIAELEQINGEARTVIDEKNEKIDQMKKEIEQKSDENRRWELKVNMYKKKEEVRERKTD